MQVPAIFRRARGEPRWEGSPIQLSALFPTVVAEIELPGAEALNGPVAALVRQMEAASAGQTGLTAVTNGWQSGLGFLEGDHREAAALCEALHAPLQAYLAELGRVANGPGAPPSFRYRIRSWAVVLRDGGFQHEHVHTRADVVGVYYVRAPVATAATGDLCLMDPRAGRVATRAIWEQTQTRIRPRPGLLVLFPAFLPHRVDVLRGPEERVSINFDVFLEPNQPG